ncbi:MAG: hypothetical protein AUG51_01075 [Acidobacteria bacterium 13_1_20CM_3_53_8]|nr:MAG: hypothetical protein AUG51_01075 [Acidobacteria bacterium 13_1_20CM_3_53_8]
MQTVDRLIINKVWEFLITLEFQIANKLIWGVPLIEDANLSYNCANRKGLITHVTQLKCLKESAQRVCVSRRRE